MGTPKDVVERQLNTALERRLGHVADALRG